MAPAIRTPSNLPLIEATRSIPATRNTAVPPIVHVVRRPVLRKNTGMIISNTFCLSVIANREHSEFSETLYLLGADVARIPLFDPLRDSRVFMRLCSHSGARELAV